MLEHRNPDEAVPGSIHTGENPGSVGAVPTKQTNKLQKLKLLHVYLTENLGSH